MPNYAKLNSHIILERKLTKDIHWQIIGMRNVGVSLCKTEHQVGRNPSMNLRVFSKPQATNDVKHHLRPGRPHKTTPRELSMGFKHIVLGSCDYPV